MRILLAIHNAYTDSTSGAAHSIRILMEWMTAAGHPCHVLGTARFDGTPPANINAHLNELGVPITRRDAAKTFVRSVQKPANVVVGRPTAHFTLHDVPVTMLMTRHNRTADRFESAQFLYLLEEAFNAVTPDVLLTYGSHPVLGESMRRARERGVITVFTLRNHGYDDRAYYAHVDHVFTTSPYLSRVYKEKIGLNSVGIASPIDWSEVLAPAESRSFVTFVNPTPGKGSLVFARLADMLGSRRPDIPIVVVQSAIDAGSLNAIPGLDFAKYPHIMAAPPLPRPSAFFAFTKILLVPSVFPEPFGRVSAEALINGIPPLVSDRGGLPETVDGGGRVIPLPAHLTPSSTELPTESEIQPWFDALCELWDDEAAYAKASTVARETAERMYSEDVLRRRYVEYFTSLERDIRLFN